MSQSDSGAVVGIDLGGTKIAAAVVIADGTVLERTLVPTEAEQGRDHVISRLVDVVQELREDTDRSIAAVGIGAPAPLSPSRGIIWEAPNMPGWEQVPLRDILEGRLGLRVALENDARAAGLAEARLGAGRDVRDMLYVSVGTGIGGALILDGKLHRGATETAGELGHMVMNPDGPICGCGNRGCLEQYAAGPAIERRAGELLRGGAESSLSSLSREEITGERVADAARRGDGVGLRAYREAGAWLGAGIASVVNLVNPSLVILGGGVANTGELLLSPLRASVRQHSLARSYEGLRIEQAQLGTDAGILGAAIAAFEVASG
ncbi:MAG: ROK family protein [Chloroflexota bacterium]